MKTQASTTAEPLASSQGGKRLASIHLRVSTVVSQVDALIGAFKAKNLRVKTVDFGKLQRTLHALEKEAAGLPGRTGSERRTNAPSDEELVEQVVGVAAQRSELDPFLDDMAAYLRSLLGVERLLEGWSRPAPLRDLLQEVAVTTEARQSVQAEPMLSAREVSHRLGSRSTNLRQYAARLRRENHLLAVPVQKNRYQFPAFQFDNNGQVFAVVPMVNQILDAESDPWGVASWWVESHASLPAGTAPKQLLGNDDEAIRALAQAEIADD
jgi:hypothetical protein